jgi:hypothetical protein
MQTNKNLIPSGLYDTPFYITEYMNTLEVDVDIIEFNMDLAKQHILDKDDYVSISDEDFEDEVRQEFYNKVFMYSHYRKVTGNNYSEEDAYKCDLIPFQLTGDYEDTYCLALGGCGMDLSPRLDAYYFLRTGNMDPASTYFRDKEYFKSLVSEEIFNAIEAKFGGVK